MTDPLDDAPAHAIATQPAAGVVQRRLVEWRNGVPTTISVPVLTKTQINSAIAAAVSQAYEPDPLNPKDLQYAGMTLMEVMLHKLAIGAARTGDLVEIDALLDRILGKPKQTSESTTIKKNYEQWLHDQAVADATPVEAEVMAAPLPPEDPLAGRPSDVFS